MSAFRTYSQIEINPVEPKLEDITIVDIAHALPLLCRGGGHLKTFFSVGLHSINCVKEAKARNYSRKVQLGCLLHDASEAYLADITRPVKQFLPQYLEIEKRLQTLIWDKYLGEALTDEEYKQVFLVDDCMLYYEFIYFMDKEVLDYKPPLNSDPVFEFLDFATVEAEFMALFNELIG